jgi:hypothetical protein
MRTAKYRIRGAHEAKNSKNRIRTAEGRIRVAHDRLRIAITE